MLRFLRRRARITQRELGLRVGYSEGHVCRLEQDRRIPELSVLAAPFVPALGLDRDPAAGATLPRPARAAPGSSGPGRLACPARADTAGGPTCRAGRAGRPAAQRAGGRAAWPG